MPHSFLVCCIALDVVLIVWTDRRSFSVIVGVLKDSVRSRGEMVRRGGSLLTKRPHEAGLGPEHLRIGDIFGEDHWMTALRLLFLI